MENPYKVGDRVLITSKTAYGWCNSGSKHFGIVTKVLNPSETYYCLWVQPVSGYPSGDDWPFGLTEVAKSENSPD